MGQVDCCQKNDPIEEDLIQIFATSPDDNKIPNDIGYFGNYGGEYPQDNDLPPRFPYEARYPSRRIAAPPSLKETASRKGNKYYDPLENKFNPESKEYIEELYLRCEAFGQIRNWSPNSL